MSRRTIVGDSTNGDGLMGPEKNRRSRRAGAATILHYDLTVYLYNILWVLNMSTSPANCF